MVLLGTASSFFQLNMQWVFSLCSVCEAGLGWPHIRMLRGLASDPEALAPWNDGQYMSRYIVELLQVEGLPGTFLKAKCHSQMSRMNIPRTRQTKIIIVYFLLVLWWLNGETEVVEKLKGNPAFFRVVLQHQTNSWSQDKNAIEWRWSNWLSFGPVLPVPVQRPLQSEVTENGAAKHIPVDFNSRNFLDRCPVTHLNWWVTRQGNLLSPADCLSQLIVKMSAIINSETDAAILALHQKDVSRKKISSTLSFTNTPACISVAYRVIKKNQLERSRHIKPDKKLPAQNMRTVRTPATKLPSLHPNDLYRMSSCNCFRSSRGAFRSRQ